MIFITSACSNSLVMIGLMHVERNCSVFTHNAHCNCLIKNQSMIMFSLAVENEDLQQDMLTGLFFFCLHVYGITKVSGGWCNVYIFPLHHY